MNKFLKIAIAAAALSAALISCSKDSDNYDYPRFGAFVVVNVDDGFYYFTGDDGETYYPTDITRIGHYSAKERDGKRSYIYFNMLPEKKEGYDYNIALYAVENILSKTVETAENDEQLAEFGDDQVRIEAAKISDKWLDVTFSLMNQRDSEHKMTLFDNKTAEVPADMPADYQYLEFRHKAINYHYGELRTGIASYDLGDYHPSVTGKKGLYIRFKNLRGNVEYATIKFEPSSNEERQIQSWGLGKPVESQDWAK